MNILRHTWCTMYDVPCTVYSVLYTMNTVHYTVYTIHCTVYIARRTTNDNYTTYSLRFQCTAYIVRHTLYDVHCTYNVRYASNESVHGSRTLYSVHSCRTQLQYIFNVVQRTTYVVRRTWLNYGRINKNKICNILIYARNILHRRPLTVK